MKRLLNPGFEFAFALGLIAIFALPPIVMAQAKKEFSVTISNNDTTINGKNIKQLSASERKEALKKLDEMSAGFSFKSGKSDTTSHFTFRMRKSGDNSDDLVIERNNGDVITMLPRMNNDHNFNFMTDSAAHGQLRKMMRDRNGFAPDMNFNFMTDSAGTTTLRKMLEEKGGLMPDMNFEYMPRAFGNGDGQAFSFSSPRMAMARSNRKNSQSFNYSNTDKDGISTHINFNAGDASAENVKRITGNEKAELEIKDLTITPQFSSGKTVISFSLPAGASEVTLKDTEGKPLWIEKTSNGSFTKSFELPKNGVYYLQVKQGTKTGLKRITKEE